MTPEQLIDINILWHEKAVTLTKYTHGITLGTRLVDKSVMVKFAEADGDKMKALTLAFERINI